MTEEAEAETKEEEEEDYDRKCIICQLEIADNDIKTIKYGCSHIFHSYCILEWINTGGKAKCPVCTLDILTPPIVVNNYDSSDNHHDDSSDDYLDDDNLTIEYYHLEWAFKMFCDTVTIIWEDIIYLIPENSLYICGLICMISVILPLLYFICQINGVLYPMDGISYNLLEEYIKSINSPVMLIMWIAEGIENTMFFFSEICYKCAIAFGG